MKDRFALRIASPLLSLIIFAMGSGLLGTLLPVQLESKGTSVYIIGALSSLFYGGYALGALFSERKILRIGSIRTYAALASIMSAIALLHGLLPVTGLWLPLRFIYGYCIVGLFVVIETWFLSRCKPTARGEALSIYMLGLYGAQSIGQWLLSIGDWRTHTHFCISSLLLSLSIVPLALTRRTSPHFTEASKLDLRSLFRLSPSGFLGSFTGGVILGVFYGLMPMVAQRLWGASGVPYVMSAVIVGGMALQYPIGRLSDYLSRRWILLGVSLTSTLVALAMTLKLPIVLFLSLCFLLGGFSFTLYPLSVSYSCDFVDSQDVIGVTGGLRVAYSVGATLGPIIAASFIHVLGPNGIFHFFSAICGLLCIAILWRSTQRRSLPFDAQKKFRQGSAFAYLTVDLAKRIFDASDNKNSK